MILLIDNYDSFTFNLYQYIGTFTQDIKVVRNDKITIGEIRELHPDKIVLSPGPKSPKEAGKTNCRSWASALDISVSVRHLGEP